MSSIYKLWEPRPHNYVFVIVQPLVVFFVIVIVAAFGSAYLPPHLFTILIGKDALLLAFGMVTQE